MRNLLTLISTSAIILTGCTPEKGMEVHELWMRSAAAGDNGAVYFVIHNHSPEADELVNVSSDMAEAVEMHESSMDGDVMKMNQLSSVPLEAFAEIEFAPGGLHLMLVSLKQDLKIGDEVNITLHFKKHEDISVRVPVRDAPALEEEH